MIRTSLLSLAAALMAGASATAQSAHADTLRLRGLRAPVEVLRDRWGIAHIYATNEHDLFFAQGYVAARDRTFQFEIWRRQATGTVAEVLGRRELQRDIGTRLFRYRGDLTAELNHYHPHGAAIVQAYVDGVNALVAETERDTSLIPIELRMLGLRPERWTAAVVISRHQGLLGNVEDELQTGRAVAAIGAAAVAEINWYHPGTPKLALDTAVDGSLLSADILALYKAFHSSIDFAPSDLVAGYRADDAARMRLAALDDSIASDAARRTHAIGSNNWVVSGRKTASGYPMMANDPHRLIVVPSLRYWVHLNAPGWDVIGGGEPVLPGVSIGHNAYGAWGLTVFDTDGEDLMVYRTNPADPREYRYQGRWARMRTIRDTIAVKGEPPAIVDLHFTRHGPVVYEDSAHHVAYAVRAAWLEPGGSPYLASLRMDQARTWAEFRAACAYSNIPGENMVWADRAGHIGWQAVGIAPIRPNFSGLVPVPGDGRYEWAGFLPIPEKPHASDPPAGFIATANNDLIPPGYAHRDAVGYTWADGYRAARIAEVLRGATKLTVADFERLQTDYLSMPARQLVPLLARVRATTPPAASAREALLRWNNVLDTASVAAGIYEAWLAQLEDSVSAQAMSPKARTLLGNVGMARMIAWLTHPGARFGPAPRARRDAIVVGSLEAAVADLTRRFGADTSAWRWGQAANHHITIEHPLGPAVDAATRGKLEVGPWPRGGDWLTVGSTGVGNQRYGASFRIIADAADWDAAVGVNTPGQSGDPRSPHYRDLFALWSVDRYFPVAYSRRRVEEVTEARTVLVP